MAGAKTKHKTARAILKYKAEGRREVGEGREPPPNDHWVRGFHYFVVIFLCSEEILIRSKEFLYREVIFLKTMVFIRDYCITIIPTRDSMQASR